MNKEKAFSWFWWGVQVGEDVRDKILNPEEAREFFEDKWIDYEPQNESVCEECKKIKPVYKVAFRDFCHECLEKFKQNLRGF